MRPQSIVRFEQAYLASIVVGLVNLFASWDTKRAALTSDPRFGGNPQMVQIGEWMLIGFSALGLLISLLLWYFAARRGSEVAKWVLVVFLTFATIGVVTSVLQIATVGALGFGLGLVSFALNAFAVWMLFKPDAKAWMRGDTAARPITER